MATLGGLAASVADRYRLERELGAGGMATVYFAHDLRHDRKVALKVLKPELAAVIGGDRFLAEIRTTANLQHPHIFRCWTAARGPEGIPSVAKDPPRCITRCRSSMASRSVTA